MKAYSINPRALGTASLVNAIDATSKQPEPEVGMGATILGYTDRYACTITEVFRVGYSKKRRIRDIVVQQDRATRTDANGMSESQDYSYEANPNAPMRFFSPRRDGSWVERGSPLNGGTRLVIGRRDHYIDPSF